MSAQGHLQGEQPQAGPSTVYYPPVLPSVPTANLQALVLRLTHAIHDIDAFQNLLASGAQNGTLPTWDNILERYTLLLSRVQALSTYIHKPPLPPSTPHPTEPSSNDPILSKYLVHPLNSLAPAGTEEGNQVNPIARDIFEWVLSTLPNPALAAFETQLLAPDPVRDVGEENQWKSLDELKTLSDGQLNKISKDLRDRLNRESRRAEAMREEIQRVEDDLDWEMRILDDAVEEQVEAEKGVDKETEANKEKEDDLFGEEDDFVMIDAHGAAVKEHTDSKASQADKKPIRDSQETWRLTDYMNYMDTGRLPVAPAP